MALFYATVQKPYVCKCDDGGEHIAWEDSMEVIVPAASLEEAREKLRKILPQEDVAVKKALEKERPGTEYFQVCIEGELVCQEVIVLPPCRS